jgi:hypothetical protein
MNHIRCHADRHSAGALLNGEYEYRPASDAHKQQWQQRLWRKGAEAPAVTVLAEVVPGVEVIAGGAVGT